MSDENKNTISKEKVLSFGSALGIIAMCWALYTGVLDRGTSVGSFNEKILTFERQLMKNENLTEIFMKKLEEKSASDQEIRIDIIKLQSVTEQLKNESKEMRRIIDEIRDRQLRGPN